MVQAKHSNAKPKKQHGVKKQGKRADTEQFRCQLDALGLKIIEMTADGNCFFRALADQLEGNEENHKKYRLMVVKHIMNHREEFEPFIEDDVPFDEYCKSMGEDGTWAGHMELQAASLVTHSNICIHRLMSPRWYIQNFDTNGTRMIHLSYHDGEHYNSIRGKEDNGTGPAKPITIKVDANLSLSSNEANYTIRKSNCSRKSAMNPGSVKIVMSGAGCYNENKVEEILHELNGDIDAAIEYLRAEQCADEDFHELNKHQEEPDGPSQSLNLDDYTKCGRGISPEQTSKGISPDNIKGFSDSPPQENETHLDEKRIARNQWCPCGSKKKYKVCCGFSKVRPTEFVRPVSATE